MKVHVPVQKFDHYRSYLVAYVQEKKLAQPQWSYRSWAKALGLKTTSSITKVLEGSRDPGPKLVEQLVTYFGFDQSESEYFRDLVRLHKLAKDPSLALLMKEKMAQSFPNGKVKIIDDKVFQVLSNWFFFAIRESTKTKNFKENTQYLADHLQFKVTPREIKNAIEVMLQRGVLKRDRNGKLSAKEFQIETTNDVTNLAIRRYHTQMLDNAKQALDLQDVFEREFTASSFAIKEADIPNAKAMIRKFKNDFCKAFNSDQGDEVVQIQIQLFKLTHFTKGETK